MSAAVLYTILTVAGGGLAVMLVPLIWTRIGILAGIAAIPLIGGLTLLAGAQIGPTIWGDTVDPANVPTQTSTANMLIFVFFALMAILMSWFVSRSGADK